ncbi:hypothetical protein [Paenalcaligenes suwonensis]|uniref:hypothetical protein n=1 Tax=Paenalcaligenes suwonensis TaxID=1202713 RepID=UPI00140BF47F|nr:hypothetical protein [Paenalcaligenes suwonensis]NHC62969.1 hypothetical protein [Paenalcaligenes suwonensis]
MKLSTIFAAILGAVIAGGGTAYYYQQDQQPAHVKSAYAALPLEKSQSGEINSASLVNLSNGVRSVPYTLTAEAGMFYKIAVTGALRAQISVLHNGMLVANSNQSSDSKASASVLAFKAETDGTYDVIVSGIDANAYGPFSITATPLKSYVGGVVTAGMDITEIAMGRKQSFTLEVPEAAIYTIDMKADQGAIDPYLDLLDKSGRELMSDDDGGDNYDAKIQTYLEPGTYTIQTSSALGADTFNGTYRLVINKADVPDVTLQSGNVLTVNGDKQAGLYMGQQQEFSFELAQPMFVSLKVDAMGFDPDVDLDSLRISFPRRQNDGSTRAILPAGTHTVSIDGSQQGVYELSLTATSLPSNVSDPVITPGQAIHAIMQSGADRVTHTLKVTQAGTYVIDLGSPSFDTYLSVQKDGYVLAENDDIDYDNDNLDSRVEVALQPGEYQVQVTMWNQPTRNREYTLEVQRK